MACRKLVLPLSAGLVAASTSAALALAPPTSPPSTPAAGSPPTTDPGLILVVVVIPVVLVALIWLGYIFWLIFHEGENVGSGSPLPPEDPDRQPSNRSPGPPDQPGSVG
ncbi:MAG: hypothetical protein OXP73_09990 [Chloroflexota bacterium]|nr:hypothetical protein [Chloroflexota bacterium]